MFFGNHYKSFSHLTHTPNETNLSVKSNLVIAWNSTYITLHNVRILGLIKAIFHKLSSCLAYFRMPFKGLQKLMGSTESKIKLNQNFPTKKNILKDFFLFLKKIQLDCWEHVNRFSESDNWRRIFYEDKDKLSATPSSW